MYDGWRILNKVLIFACSNACMLSAKVPMHVAQEEQGGVCYDILTTQVNIRQLQGTLDTYSTIPTSGNI